MKRITISIGNNLAEMIERESNHTARSRAFIIRQILKKYYIHTGQFRP